jgi:hypothetical protein
VLRARAKGQVDHEPLGVILLGFLARRQWTQLNIMRPSTGS